MDVVTLEQAADYYARVIWFLEKTPTMIYDPEHPDQVLIPDPGRTAMILRTLMNTSGSA